MTRSAPDNPPPHDRLSAHEREILLMLADGHTAKSIAAQTGRSIAAVNERLRQARRKSGAASSRELARLIKAQQNRDEQIDLEPAPMAGPILPPRKDRRKGLIFMVTVLAVLGAVPLALLAPHGSVPASGGMAHDPVLNGLESSFDQPNPATLDTQWRNEARDPAWAPAMEGRLGERYANERQSGRIQAGRIQVRRIGCARSLCEVVFTLISGTKAQDEALILGLQDRTRDKALEEAGLTPVMTFFGQDAVMLFWRRKT